MIAIKFAEWLAENHYVLFNIDKLGNYIWKNEKHERTTEELFKEYKLNIFQL